MNKIYEPVLLLFTDMNKAEKINILQSMRSECLLNTQSVKSVMEWKGEAMESHT